MMLSEFVGYQLKQVQQALRRAMDATLGDLGLSTAQYAALAVLEESPHLSSAELARRSFVTAQTMGGIVTGLERAALVERRPHPAHGRILETALTPQGRLVLRTAHERVRNVEERLLRDLSGDERQVLLDLLRRCATGLGTERSLGV